MYSFIKYFKHIRIHILCIHVARQPDITTESVQLPCKATESDSSTTICI